MNSNTETTAEVRHQMREVYAQFGRAMYYAQCVELGLASIVTVLIAAKTPHLTVDDDLRSLGTEFEKTLRKLIRHLEAQMDLPQDLRDSLVRALRMRDFLAHGFFRDRWAGFRSKHGRQAMASELSRYAGDLRQADESLKGVMKSILTKRGLTEDDLAATRACLRRTLDGIISSEVPGVPGTIKDF